MHADKWIIRLQSWKPFYALCKTSMEDISSNPPQ